MKKDKIEKKKKMNKISISGLTEFYVKDKSSQEKSKKKKKNILKTK
jgi:hypothetical protein